MNIDFRNMAQALAEANLMHKPLADMSKEEIEHLCKIICYYAIPAGAADVPF